jgi:hypothetical protein
MSNGLKQSLIKKLDVNPSPNFDSQFFEKLEREKKRPSLFSNWITLLVSGCAMASVLFVAINVSSPRASFNHREYVDSVLEVQRSMTEDITDDDMIDLTSVPSDEI